jgi:hypothetical protein
MSMFIIIIKVAFIFKPSGEQIKLMIVRCNILISLYFIIQNALSMELIILPLTFISKAIVSIIEMSKTIHLITQPLSLIIPSILKIQDSFPFSPPFLHLPFITSSILIILNIFFILFSSRLLVICFHHKIKYIICIRFILFF